MNYNNPFSILNSSNIDNLELQHNIKDIITNYAKDLINKKKSYSDFEYFCNTRLKDYDLPNNINHHNLSNNYYLHLHGSTKEKKGGFKIPNNVYIILLENYGKTWNSKIINYLLERMKLQNNFDENMIKSIIIETSLLELFRLQEEVKNKNNNQLSIEEILNNEELYIQKYFKIYKANDKINDFELTSEEKNHFYSGLFKLPAKSYIAYQGKNQNHNNNGFTLVKSKKRVYKRNINSSGSINENWKVISHTKIKNALLHPDNEINKNIIHQLLYPSITNIRVEENDYYTLHVNYLRTLKENPKFRLRLEKMHTLQRDLRVNVKSLSNVKKTKVLYFKNMLQKIITKAKPTNEKPFILFCNFCTVHKNKKYYPQNEIIKNENENQNQNENQNRNENENQNRNKTNTFIYLDYETYGKKLTKNKYLEEIQRIIFDLYLANAVQNIYINKINKKVYGLSFTKYVGLINSVINDINKYIELIENNSENMEEIKKYEKNINDFYNSEDINHFHNIIYRYKNDLYQLFLENNMYKINILCEEILFETQRLFNDFKKRKIFYNSKKRVFKEINYFYNTFYPSIHFFTGNCTYAYTFIQYLLFIVYAHTRKVIKSLVYHTFENVTHINNSNYLNMEIKDDFISRIINIHYKRRNKKFGIILYYDSILYNVIYDLHKIYTNNNLEFGVHKRQFKSLLVDLGDYYHLYLKNDAIYENIGNLLNNYITPEHIFENRNYTENELRILENRNKNGLNVNNGNYNVKNNFLGF
jgi:hypothetical protein